MKAFLIGAALCLLGAGCVSPTQGAVSSSGGGSGLRANISLVEKLGEVWR